MSTATIPSTGMSVPPNATVLNARHDELAAHCAIWEEAQTSVDKILAREGNEWLAKVWSQRVNGSTSVGYRRHVDTALTVIEKAAKEPYVKYLKGYFGQLIADYGEMLTPLLGDRDATIVRKGVGWNPSWGSLEFLLRRAAAIETRLDAAFGSQASRSNRTKGGRGNVANRAKRAEENRARARAAGAGTKQKVNSTKRS